jgi:hypothetical protein
LTDEIETGTEGGGPVKKITMKQKKVLAIGVYICLAVFTVMQAAVSPAQAAGKLTVTPAHYDFGEVPEGPPASMTAVLENAGDAVLTIKSVRTHCACTSSELGAQTLKPGEKTTLKIIYATVDRPGVFRKNITIETDTKGQEEVEMEVVGSVKEAPGAKIQVTPRKADVGSLKKGVSKKITLAINNGGALPLVIKKIYGKASGAMYFDGAKQGDILVEAGKTRQIEIEYKPGQSGQFTDVVLIDSNAKNAPKGGFAFMVVGKGEE